MTVVESPSRLIARASLGLPPFVAPDGELESKIAAIFAEVFNLDQAGATDDFFDLGGDSLLAETLALRIAERTGQDFPISNLVLQGSPRKISALLNPPSGDALSSPARRHLRPPIFVLPGGPGYALLTPQFAAALAEGQQLHTLEIPGLRGGATYDRLEDIAAAHIEELESVHPDGPILLAAICSGCLVALEMARQLAAKGRPVQQLVLFDPVNPYRFNKTKRYEFDGTVPDDDWVEPRHARWQRYLPAIRLLDRLRPGTLAHDIRKYQRRFAHKERRSYGRLQRRSGIAHAKFYAASEHYDPHVFRGPAAVLASREKHQKYRNSSHGWAKLLPEREVHIIAEMHRDLTNPDAARIMQSIFDSALARVDRPPAHNGEAEAAASENRLGSAG